MKIGERQSFIPCAFVEYTQDGMPKKQRVPVRVSGEIVFIHWAHRYYMLEYQINGCTLYESFKF